MSKNYCLVCRGDVKAGRRIAVDPLASLILEVKLKMGISGSRGKVVVVCPSCIPEYKRRWAKFKGKAIQLSLIALAAFAVQTYFVGALTGLVFALFILSFLLIYYVPRLEPAAQQAPARAK